MTSLIVKFIQFFPYELKLFRFLLKPFVFFLRLKTQSYYTKFKGVKFILHPSLSLHQTGILIYPRIFEKKMIKVLSRKIKNKGIFIDLGSHSGFYALLAKSLISKVSFSYAFEIDSVAIDWIKTNISINNFERKVFLINKAVSGKITNFKLIVNNKNRGSNFITSANYRNKNKTITLSSWFNKKINTKISAIKLDIEGQEFDVLCDMFENIKNNFWPDVIIVEINHNFKKAKNISKILEKNYYKFVAKENQNYAYEKIFKE